MRVGDGSYEGEFKQGIFSKGIARTHDGRVLEIDVAQKSILEVHADGSKVPITPEQLLAPEAATESPAPQTDPQP